MSDDSDDTDDMCTLSYSRGADADEFLSDVENSAQARMSGAGADRPSCLKLITTAIQSCGRKERRLLINDAWLKKLTQAQLLEITGPPPVLDEHGVPAILPPPVLAPGRKWKLFGIAFRLLFPNRSRALVADEFLSIKQDAELTEYIPEYMRLYRKANGNELDLNDTNLHQVLHFIKSTAGNWDKRIRKKYPALMPMQEDLMEQFHLKQRGGLLAWTIGEYMEHAQQIEDKLMPKIAKLNSKLPKIKKIPFYGTHDEVQQDFSSVNFVQEEYVTKTELSKMFTDHKTEFRNETQATIQSAVGAVRGEIVGDVKEMFSSLSKKMDKDKDEVKLQQQQQFESARGRPNNSQGYSGQQGRQQRDNYYGPPPSNGYQRNNSRFQDRFRPAVRQPYGNRRSGGNRADATGNRACYICGDADHSFMDCSKFHDPAFAQKKEAAFKLVRRGINHIEAQVDSSDADAVRNVFDPEGQEDDQMIMHVAQDSLHHMERSSTQGDGVISPIDHLNGTDPCCVEVQAANSRTATEMGATTQLLQGDTRSEPAQAAERAKGLTATEPTVTATAVLTELTAAKEQMTASTGNSISREQTIAVAAAAILSACGAAAAATYTVRASSLCDGELHRVWRRLGAAAKQMCCNHESEHSQVTAAERTPTTGSNSAGWCHVTDLPPVTTAESRALAHELERLWNQFTTATSQLRKATKTGDEAHQQQLICDITAVQEPLETLVRTWEELATRKPQNAVSLATPTAEVARGWPWKEDGSGSSTAYLTPEQIEKCRAMREDCRRYLTMPGNQLQGAANSEANSGHDSGRYVSIEVWQQLIAQKKADGAAAAESTAADVTVQPAPDLSTLTVPLEPAAVKNRARSPDAKPQQATQAQAAADKATVRLKAEPTATLTAAFDSATAKQQAAEAVAAADTATSNTAQAEAVFCLECMDRLEPELGCCRGGGVSIEASFRNFSLPSRAALQRTAQPSQTSTAEQQPADKQQDAAPEGEDYVKHHLTTPRNRMWMLATVVHATVLLLLTTEGLPTDGSEGPNEASTTLLQTSATTMMALILTAATAYCATKAFEKLNSSDASDVSIADDSQASSSHLTKLQKESKAQQAV